MFRISILFAFVLGLAPVLLSQDILVLGLNGDLHSVDINTGDATYIGDAGLHTHFWSAMAMDSQGRLFASYGAWNSAYEIYELDPNTGRARFVAQTNLFGIGCMAFGPGNVLYIGNDRTAPTYPHPYDLYTLDLNTGTETLIGAMGARTVLAMDFSNGILWGHPFVRGLVQIDTSTGLATDVNTHDTGPLGSTASMCFNDAGTLYYLDAFLWMMDTETGVGSIVDYLTPFGFWAEAVFREGPESPFSLWLSGVTGAVHGGLKVKLAGATPGGDVAVAWTAGTGGPTTISAGHPCAGVTLNLNHNMRLLGVVTADSVGNAEIGPQIVPPSAIGRFRIQAVDLTTCKVSNRVMVAY